MVHLYMMDYDQRVPPSTVDRWDCLQGPTLSPGSAVMGVRIRGYRIKFVSERKNNCLLNVNANYQSTDF